MADLRVTNGVGVRSGVVGVKETIEALRSAGIELSGPPVRRALYAGVKIIRDSARARVSVRSGALKKSIVAETRQVGPKVRGVSAQHVGVVTIAKKAFTINPKSKKARGVKREKGQIAPYKRGQVYPRLYAHLVEFGSRPHSVAPKGSKMVLPHPGARPKPFMRPAFDESIGAAQAAVLRTLQLEAAKIAAKKARKAGGKR